MALRWPIRAALVIAGLQFGLAQTGTGDRGGVTQPETTPTDSGWVDHALRLIEPAPHTPLTERQRYHDYWESSIGPVAFVSQAFNAGLQSLLNSPEEWGQRGSGYAKRFGNDMAFNGIENTLTYGTSILLHEDNRYFASRDRRLSARIAHTMTSTILATRENGKRSVSISSVTGMVGATLISRAWWPPSWRHPSDIGVSVALAVGAAAGLNAVREFVPGIVRHFRRK